MKCRRCKVDKDEAYFAPHTLHKPFPTCRRCYLHTGTNRATLQRLALWDARDSELLESVTVRKRFIAREATKHKCKRCSAPAQVFVSKQGIEGRLELMAEQLCSDRLLRLVMARLTPLCGPCSLGSWSDTDVTPQTPQEALRLAQRMAAKYRARTMRLAESARAPMWRAVYYWDRKVKEARRACEREEAERLDALPVPTTPWFGEVDE